MQKKRIVLGIDPGSNYTGYAIISIASKQPEVLCIGVEKLVHLNDHMSKLKALFDCIHGLIQKWEPQELAIEEPFFGKNVQSMLKLGKAQGVIIAAALYNGLTVNTYEPRRVKQSVTGKGSSSKEQVSAMICHILGIEKGKLSNDATDAAAIALCHIYSGQKENLPTKQKAKSNNKWDSFIRNNPDRLIQPD